jgi:hypothetical protein
MSRMKLKLRPLSELTPGWTVDGCDLDHEPPYCTAFNDGWVGKKGDSPRAFAIPLALAYYLRTHFCGSHTMEQAIVDKTRKYIAGAIGGALGVDLLRLEP